MKQIFNNNLRLYNKNKQQLTIINKIIAEFQEQGYILTLRQLYYQLVSRAIIGNSQKEYAKLSALLVNARMSGVVDWDAIEELIDIDKFNNKLEQEKSDKIKLQEFQDNGGLKQ